MTIIIISKATNTDLLNPWNRWLIWSGLIIPVQYMYCQYCITSLHPLFTGNIFKTKNITADQMILCFVILIIMWLFCYCQVSQCYWAYIIVSTIKLFQLCSPWLNFLHKNNAGLFAWLSSKNGICPYKYHQIPLFYYYKLAHIIIVLLLESILEWPHCIQ